VRTALAAAALLAPAAAHADALQDRVLAAARATSPERFAFQRSVRFARTGADAKTVVEGFDPRRAPDARWQLVSVDGRAPTKKDLADWRKQKRGDTPSYHEVAKWFGGPATATPTGPGRVLYRFARLPAGTFKINNRDLSADTAAEALVNTAGRVPFVERTQLRSTKGFRMMLVAKLDSMTATGRYRQLADGQVVPDGVTSDITGSLMGKNGTMTVRIAYSDQRAVR
jgi:hypothetical protein